MKIATTDLRNKSRTFWHGKSRISVSIYGKKVRDKIPVRLKKIQSVARLVLSGEGCFKNISIVITHDNKIRMLNKRFMKKDRPTDVLAFGFTDRELPNINPASLPTGQAGLLGEQGGVLGDIVVSADRAIVNAKLYKTSPKEELYLYLIHGILHLLGYDDTTPRKRVMMRKKEQYYLKRIGLRGQD